MKHLRYFAGLAGLILAGAVGAGAYAQGTPAAAPPPPSKAATHPRFLSGPAAEFPDAARAAGEFGKVAVSGTIGADGKLHDAKIAVSSRSVLLDASALAAANAAVFEPAHDAQGVAIAVPAQIPYGFSNAKTPGKGGVAGGQRLRDEMQILIDGFGFEIVPVDAAMTRRAAVAHAR